MPAVHVYLGEAYPSGQMYLQPFQSDADHDAGKQPEFVATLGVTALNGKAAQDKEIGDKVRSATFRQVLKTELERKKDKKSGTEVIKSVYIPSKEGLSNIHDESCGLKTTLLPSAGYADGDDFFASISDNCYFDDKIGVYALGQPAAKLKAFQVIAVAGELTDIKRHEAEKLSRPLTPAEAKEVAKEKKELAKQAAKLECTTEPTYLDSAYVLFSAKVQGSKQSLRVSTYGSPGCGGHLAQIYLLDVIEDGKIVAKQTLMHYEGLL
jgi:hypothetical protein